MPNLFGIDGAQIIHEAMSPGLLDLTLMQYESGTRLPGDLTAGTQPTMTTYTGKGFIDDYQDSMIDGTLVLRGDRMVVIIANSLSSPVVPVARDEIAIEGETYMIVPGDTRAGGAGGVKRDPFGATYTCQVRRK